MLYYKQITSNSSKNWKHTKLTCWNCREMAFAVSDTKNFLEIQKQVSQHI